MPVGESAFDLFAPLPAVPLPVDGWRAVPIEECGEPLVPLGLLAPGPESRIFTSAIYAGEYADSPYAPSELPGALLSVFVRSGVAAALVAAEQLLATALPDEHLHVLVYDGYRPLTVQRSLRLQYEEAVRAQMPDLSTDELRAVVDPYVAEPSADPLAPAAHLTGACVDFALYRLPPAVERDVHVLHREVQRDGNEARRARLERERQSLLTASAEVLDVGVAFDHGGEQAHAGFFERHPEGIVPAERAAEVVRNRRLTANVMRAVGGSPYPFEIWEAAWDTQESGVSVARYGAATLSPAHQNSEQRRREFAIDAVRATALPPAARLSPGHSSE